MLEANSALESFLQERQVEGEFRAQLLALDAEAQAVVGRLVSVLAPSANALRELLSMATEVAARDKATLQDVLSEREILTLIADLDSQQRSSNKKQLFAEVKQHLFARRYPEVARVQSRLAALQKEIATRFGLRVELPPELEGDKLSVSVAARSAEDFAKVGAALLELSRSEQLREVYALLKGEEGLQ
jgi:hypothetical protein